MRRNLDKYLIVLYRNTDKQKISQTFKEMGNIFVDGAHNRMNQGNQDYFNNGTMDILHRYVHSRNIINYRHLPWIDRKIRKLMTTRRKAYCIYKKNRQVKDKKNIQTFTR